MNFFLQFPLDYTGNDLIPPLEEMQFLPDQFCGLMGTHYLAECTLEYLQKFNKKKYSKSNTEESQNEIWHLKRNIDT